MLVAQHRKSPHVLTVSEQLGDVEHICQCNCTLYRATNCESKFATKTHKYSDYEMNMIKS